MSDRVRRKREYEQALRWYPAEWRQVHGPALVGDLMDQDDARGRQRLAMADHISLLAQGLRMRSLQRRTPSSPAITLRLTALLGSAFFTIFYWTTSPSDLIGALPAGTSVIQSHEAKTFLNNGTVVPLVVLTLALTVSIARRDALARLLGGAAALAALVVTQLALGTWNGPDAPVGTALVIFGIMAAVPGRRWATVAGFITLVAAVLLFELWLAWSSPVLIVATCVCLVAAVVIGSLALRHWLQDHHHGSTESGATP